MGDCHRNVVMGYLFKCKSLKLPMATRAQSQNRGDGAREAMSDRAIAAPEEPRCCGFMVLPAR
jgi:hypothetical protein